MSCLVRPTQDNKNQSLHNTIKFNALPYRTIHQDTMEYYTIHYEYNTMQYITVSCISNEFKHQCKHKYSYTTKAGSRTMQVPDDQVHYNTVKFRPNNTIQHTATYAYCTRNHPSIHMVFTRFSICRRHAYVRMLRQCTLCILKLATHTQVSTPMN